MESYILDVLCTCPLFFGCSKSEIETMVKKCNGVIETYLSKEEIHTEKEGKTRLGIVLSGKVSVLSKGENRAVLNRLSEGALFGISAFFGSVGAGTKVVAEKECKILFIYENLSDALWQNRVIRKNLFRFLTDRICFLNRKIAFFTEGNAKNTLFQYLLNSADHKGLCKISPSYSALANELNLSRASLYRAIEELEQEGSIQKEKNEIKILDYKNYF